MRKSDAEKSSKNEALESTKEAIREEAKNSRRGRPKKEEKRDVLVAIYFLPEEIAAIKEYASKMHTQISPFIRKITLDFCREGLKNVSALGSEKDSDNFTSLSDSLLSPEMQKLNAIAGNPDSPLFTVPSPPAFLAENDDTLKQSISAFYESAIQDDVDPRKNRISKLKQQQISGEAGRTAGTPFIPRMKRLLLSRSKARITQAFETFGTTLNPLWAKDDNAYFERPDGDQTWDNFFDEFGFCFSFRSTANLVPECFKGDPILRLNLGSKNAGNGARENINKDRQFIFVCFSKNLPAFSNMDDPKQSERSNNPKDFPEAIITFAFPVPLLMDTNDEFLESQAFGKVASAFMPAPEGTAENQTELFNWAPVYPNTLASYFLGVSENDVNEVEAKTGRPVDSWQLFDIEKFAECAWSWTGSPPPDIDTLPFPEKYNTSSLTKSSILYFIGMAVYEQLSHWNTILSQNYDSPLVR